MSAFERQLAAIKNKAELHEWIDGLEDTDMGILLIEKADGAIKFYEYGDIDRKTTNWMLTATQSYLMNCVEKP